MTKQRFSLDQLFYGFLEELLYDEAYRYLTDEKVSEEQTERFLYAIDQISMMWHANAENIWEKFLARFPEVEIKDRKAKERK